MGATREEIDKETKDDENQIEHFKNAANHGGQVLYVEGMQHYNFADAQFLSPILRLIGMTGNMSTARAASIVNHYTLDFFDKYLKNKNGSLLEGPNNEYPEVKMGTFLFGEDSK
ncbi:hypothetical protein GCM10010912_48810 [Paenibacillus albidus]|uniref:Alpha/beta hydrolase n=1 Tax=Paenibacillus albidus TaxID=2041023 RepID=A0A917FSI8_9BACL|nr:hypothetical protein [Paenibacillus albidus]GGF98379.1 hypothetical protein GCM10010912_48810 [Paenibacillus albidus]